MTNLVNSEVKNLGLVELSEDQLMDINGGVLAVIPAAAWIIAAATAGVATIVAAARWDGALPNSKACPK